MLGSLRPRDVDRDRAALPALANDPDAVAADEGLRENLSLSMGPRFHIKAERGWLRPSVACNGGLTGCLASNSLPHGAGRYSLRLHSRAVRGRSLRRRLAGEDAQAVG